MNTNQLVLSRESPKPGVSTTVNAKWTPLSFNRVFVVSTVTVFFGLKDGPGYSLEYTSARNNELMSVDFPRPDSPNFLKIWIGILKKKLTNDHESKFKALFDGFSVDLVWQIRETHIAVQFLRFLGFRWFCEQRGLATILVVISIFHNC